MASRKKILFSEHLKYQQGMINFIRMFHESLYFKCLASLAAFGDYYTGLEEEK